MIKILVSKCLLQHSKYQNKLNNLYKNYRMQKCMGHKCGTPQTCKCRKKITVPIIWVLGGPGSGKGTQCDKIVKKYNFEHLSTGELLRTEVASGSEKGKELSKIMADGQLVSNEDVLTLLELAIKKVEKNAKGFLIDGYPRQQDQGVEFEKYIGPVDLILYFKCSDDVLIARILQRAKESSTVRPDDNEATLKVRIATFRENTDGILAQYPDKTVIINGDRGVDDIFAEVVQGIETCLAQKEESQRN